MNKKESFWVVIPARLESTRLPKKILVDICGKPMIAHVINRAKKSGAERVIVATDNNEIKKTSEFHGAEAILTSKDHSNGSDRLAEALHKLDANDNQIVINLQGDEPLMNPKTITNLAFTKATNEKESVATVVTNLKDAKEINNPNCVKAVLDSANNALYFSRLPIPFHNNIDSKNNFSINNKINFYRHIGIYAFNVKALKKFIDLGPCKIEKLEKLEQLRWLWMGEKIKVLIDNSCSGIGVDTKDDLVIVRKIFKNES
jgi:3-deoxy-manno-octulosonate cytidylyltransferase (CMP-KDO synthetase)